MKKFINIISKAAMVFMAIAITASCVFEQHDTLGEAKKENVLVQIAVNTSAMTATKADIFDGGTQAPVPTIETDIKTLRLYAYIDGRLCGYLYEEDVDTENDALLMDMILPDNGTVDIDMVAIANERGMTVPEGVNLDYTVARNPDGTLSLTGNAGQDEFNSITFALADQKFENGMPMYSTSRASINVSDARRLNEQDGHKGHFIIETPVSLTLSRPLAKVAVYAAEEGPAAEEGETEKYNVKVNSVTISNVISSGNLFPGQTLPTGFAQSHAMSTTEVLVNKKIDPTSATFNTDRSNPENFTLLTPTPYYIPENGAGNTGTSYRWNEEVDKATIITVNYTTGSGSAKDAVIFLPKIQRNNFYKILCLIKANGEIELTLQVLPWTVGADETINFVDNVTLSGGITWTGNVDVEGNTVTYKGSSADNTATCTFTLETPKAGMWYATLEGGDMQSFAFADGTRTMSGPIVPDTPVVLNLKTMNNNQFMGEKKVHLKLTAKTYDGRTLTIKVGENQAAYYTLVQPEN